MRRSLLTLLLVVLLSTPVWAQPPVTATSPSPVTLSPDCDPILEEFAALAPVSLSLSAWYALGWMPGLCGAWAVARR